LLQRRGWGEPVPRNRSGSARGGSDQQDPVLSGTAVDQPWILLQFWTDPPSDRSSRDLGSILWAAIIMKAGSEFRVPRFWPYQRSGVISRTDRMARRHMHYQLPFPSRIPRSWVLESQFTSSHRLSPGTTSIERC